MTSAAIDAELASFEAAIQRVELKFGRYPEQPQTSHVIANAFDVPWYRRGAAVLLGVCVAVAMLLGAVGYGYHTYIGKVRETGQPASAPLEARSDPQRAPETQSDDAPLPYIFMRQLVPYRTSQPAGTIIIDKAQHYLYVTLPNVAAVRYAIALGTNCANSAGLYQVARKLEPGDSMLLVQTVPGSSSTEQNSTAGERALYLGRDLHFIHGTTATRSIGMAVRSGCFQIINRDFADLFNRASVGTRIVVN